MVPTGLWDGPARKSGWGTSGDTLPAKQDASGFAPALGLESPVEAPVLYDGEPLSAAPASTWRCKGCGRERTGEPRARSASSCIYCGDTFVAVGPADVPQDAAAQEGACTVTHLPPVQWQKLDVPATEAEPAPLWFKVVFAVGFLLLTVGLNWSNLLWVVAAGAVVLLAQYFRWVGFVGALACFAGGLGIVGAAFQVGGGGGYGSLLAVILLVFSLLPLSYGCVLLRVALRKESK